MTQQVGVKKRERQRQEAWEALGLPDPVTVLHEEKQTREWRNLPNFRHPARAVLDAYFAEHGDAKKPHKW